MKLSFFLLCLCVSVLLGCGNSKPAAPSPPDGLQAINAHADKILSQIKKQKAAESKLRDELKADPSPVAALALEKIRKAYAEEAGDAAASAAKITVDESTIKTFGGEKWTVRGNYNGKDAKGKDKNVTWEATAQIMFSKLQIRNMDLEVTD